MGLDSCGDAMLASIRSSNYSPMRPSLKRLGRRPAQSVALSHVSCWHRTDMPTLLSDVRCWGQSGKHLLAASISPFDPDVWSGRALQEVFVELSDCGLSSMYPVSSWSCFAPDHHGYQRACDLINGQASTGPCGSPVFARARKTEPHSRLILSQPSAGNC